jgi:hypothetical protein
MEAVQEMLTVETICKIQLSVHRSDQKIEAGAVTRHSHDCPLSPGKSEDLIWQPKKVSFFTSLTS